MLSDKYELKVDTLGPEKHHKQEVKVLNRILQWGEGGIDYEPDQRHAEVVVRELGLENAKELSTPWSAEESNIEEGEDSKLITGEEATRYRAITARLNYLALDRPDLQYATKEVSKRMANPREAAWKGLKRIGRYIVGAPRLVQPFAGR